MNGVKNELTIATKRTDRSWLEYPKADDSMDRGTLRMSIAKSGPIIHGFGSWSPLAAVLWLTAEVTGAKLKGLGKVGPTSADGFFFRVARSKPRGGPPEGPGTTT